MQQSASPPFLEILEDWSMKVLVFVLTQILSNHFEIYRIQQRYDSQELIRTEAL
jgi:hypothetical protein